MPKLPDAVERSTVASQRGVVPIDANQGVPNAIEGFARVAGTVAAQRQDELDQFDIARAQSEVLRSHNAITHDLVDDNYGTYESRYTEYMKNAISTAAQFVKSPRARVAFMQSSQNMLLRGQEKVFGMADAKKNDLGRGQLIDLIDNNRQASLEAKSEDERVAFIRNSHAAIDGARKQGFIDAEQAANLRKKTATDFATAQIEVMPYDKQIEALTKAGSSTEQKTAADFLDEDVKQTLLQRAIAGQRAQESALETARNRQRQQSEIDAANLIQNSNGDLRAVTPDLWHDLTPSTRSSLMAYAEKLSKGETIQTNWDAYAKLHLMQGKEPNKFAKVDLPSYRAELSDEHYAELVKLQASELANERQGPTAAYTATTQINDALVSAGIDPNDKKDSVRERVRKFRESVDAEMLDVMKSTGKKELSSLEIKDIIDRQLVQGTVRGSGFGGFFRDRKYAFELMPGEQLDVNVPEADQRAIKATLLKRYTEDQITDKMITDFYLSMRRARQ